MESTNAQLECSAADERAKILASEVIGLEEKVIDMYSVMPFVLFVLLPVNNHPSFIIC